MPIPCVCPQCQYEGDLTVFARADEWARAVLAAGQLPATIGRRLPAYLALFKPAHKRLAAGKCARLLEELQQAITSAQVKRNGLIWSAPLPMWEMAIDSMTASPPDTLPLGGNEYLYATVAGLAAKAVARQEREQEEQRKRGADGPQRGAQSVAGIVAEVMAAAAPPTAPPPAPVSEEARKAHAAVGMSVMRDMLRRPAPVDFETARAEALAAIESRLTTQHETPHEHTFTSSAPAPDS